MTQSENGETLMHPVASTASSRLALSRAYNFAARFFVTAVLAGMCAVPAAATQRMHVSLFTITTDRSKATTSDLVQLTIRAKINEHIDSIDSLTLPDLPGFQIVNNEQHLTQGSPGTDFLETITLMPQVPGHYEIGPVTITAIDSASASSTPVDIQTETPAIIDVTDGENYAEVLQRNMSVPIVTAICIGFAFFFGRMWFTSISEKLASPRKTLPQPEPVPVAPEPSEPPPPTRLQRLQAAMKHARREPTRQNALELRAALRDVLGAGPDETLSDIIVRLPDGERGLYARALRAVERAAFIDDHERMTAIEDGLVVVEAARDRLEKEHREHS